MKTKILLPLLYMISTWSFGQIHPSSEDLEIEKLTPIINLVNTSSNQYSSARINFRSENIPTQNYFRFYGHKNKAGNDGYWNLRINKLSDLETGYLTYLMFMDETNDIRFNTSNTFTNGEEFGNVLIENGNVGIGQDEPIEAKLHIYRDTNMGGWGAFNPSRSSVKLESGTYSMYLDGRSIYTTSGTFRLATLGASPIVFGTNQDEKMRIDHGGNVGINTPDPTNAQLHIYRGTSMGNIGEFDLTKSHLRMESGSYNMYIDGRSLYSTGGRMNISTIDNNALAFGTKGIERIRIIGNGNVGIGTTSPTALLSVAGTMDAREIKVETTAGADYVLEEDYQLPTLEETAAFIKENHRLPEIPSEKEMIAEGINLGEMNILLLKKIEELTLHLIDKDNEMVELKNRLEVIEQKLK